MRPIIRTSTECLLSVSFVAATAWLSSCAIPGASPNTAPSPMKLSVPQEGSLPVAFVLGEDAEVLDFTGPLEVFAGAWTTDSRPLFQPYYVAASLEPVTVGGGMRVVPDYTFANAPAPKVIVIPAMSDDVPAAMLDWIRRMGPGTDVTMSVCNGAFVLARTGLLDGRRATAHHGSYFRFAGTFPNVKLERGARFVEDGNLACAGGVSSGIDLALRVVERYLGRERTEELVDGLEYLGTGWRDASSNEAFARFTWERRGRLECPLCQMEGDPQFQSELRGRTYWFCSADEKAFFDAHPEVMERFLAEDAARAPKQLP